MGKAVSYALGQWESLEMYLQDAQIEIDNNLVENTIRPTALGKKNWLFFDNESGQGTSSQPGETLTSKLLRYEGEEQFRNFYLRQEYYWTYLTGAGGLFLRRFSYVECGSRLAKCSGYTREHSARICRQIFQKHQLVEIGKLVPDINNTFVTAGYGTFAPANKIEAVSGGDYSTGGISSDGTVGLVYVPAGGSVTLNMVKFSGPVSAKWYDPTTTATYAAISTSWNHNRGVAV